MKTTILKLAVILLILTGILNVSSCQSDLNENPENQQSGIPPSSIADVVDVFELKYGEMKECVYDDWTFRLSILNIEDNLFCGCDPFAYIPPEEFNKSKIHIYLHVKTGEKVAQMRVSSRPRGPVEYKNDGTDIQHVWNLLDFWQSDTDTKKNFAWNCGDGARLINTPFSIYMAKAYPFAYLLDYNPENSMYKFIFIITKK